MKAYAEKAGMVQGRHTPKGVQASPHRLIICLEPEAASFYCLHVSKGLKLSKGDQYLIADIGGGTVDIVVHEKASADGLSGAELEVKEVVASYGGLCGGSYVYKNFDEFLRKTIGCFEQYAADKPTLRMELQRTWEMGKRSYNGKLKSPFAFSLSAGLAEAWEDYEEQAGMEPRESYDEMELNNEDMKQIFDPVVNEIIRLIGKELNSKTKAIMVVGGFSASPYLMERITQEFSRKVKKIINPPEPGGGICHGAVLMGLAPEGGIVSRIARKTYGTSTSEEFKPGHPEGKRFSADGVDMCHDIFCAYVYKGSELPVNHKVIEVFYPVYSRATKMGISIHSSSLLTYPAYATDNGVAEDGRFSMDLSDDLDKDKKRGVEVTMYFGKSSIEVRGRRTNFGDTEKIETFWVELAD